MKRIWIPFIILLLLIGVTTQVFAVDMIGSKAFGMGGAFTAVADDASSLYWNPAGLTQNRVVGGEVSVGIHAESLLELSSIAEGLIFGSQYQTIPMQGGITAFIGANLGSYSGALIREEDFCFDGGTIYTDSQMTGNLAFARQLRLLGKISVGVNLKMIQKTFTTYTHEGEEELSYTGQGFAFDVGVLWPVTRFLNLGATVKNLGPNMQLMDGFDTMIYPQAQKATLGAAFHLGDFTLAADLEHGVLRNHDIVRVGLEERILFGLIALRGGVETSLNQEMALTLTGGLGLHLGALEANLALASKDYFANDWNGLISVSLEF